MLTDAGFGDIEVKPTFGYHFRRLNLRRRSVASGMAFRGLTDASRGACGEAGPQKKRR